MTQIKTAGAIFLHYVGITSGSARRQHQGGTGASLGLC